MKPSRIVRILFAWSMAAGGVTTCGGTSVMDPLPVPNTTPPNTTPPNTTPPANTPPADWTVDSTHVRLLISLVGKPADIAPYLAESFEFREVQPPSPPQSKAEFLGGMAQMVIDYTDMTLIVDSVLTHRPDSLEARGRFSALYKERTRFNLHFAVTIRFDAAGRVDRWWDHFRPEPF